MFFALTAGQLPPAGMKSSNLQINSICRLCLSDSGHFREIFASKIPMFIKYCGDIEIAENDGLPNKVCVACFRQITKFYNFKRKMEKSNRILQSYLKQNKGKMFSDILHKAVNDAQIEILNENVANLDKELLKIDNKQMSIDNNSTNEHNIATKQNVIETNQENFIATKQNVIATNQQFIYNEAYEHTNKTTTIIDNSKKGTLGYENVINDSNSQIKIIRVDDVSNVESALLPQIIIEGPPPLVPLINTVQNSFLKEAPPLLPIKPASLINEQVITTEKPKEAHKDFKIACNLCNEEFKSMFALKEHRLANCQNNLLQCNICKKEFKERKKLIGHLKGHMVTKDFSCKICGKRYPNQSTFKVHMRSHTGERPFKCHICNKGFVRWAGVVAHLRIHDSAKPYICETCGRGFKISSNLERHKILHTGMLPYCCNYCGKSFCQSDNLQLHIRTYHTHEKPFLCNVCGKGFVSSTRLRRHMWVHTGYKPYRCSVCSKTYSNSNDLKNHQESHNENAKSEEGKLFECSVCSLKFSHQCRLSKHMKIHNKAFTCIECKKGFDSDELYNKHMASKHNILPVSEVYFTL